MYTIGEVVYGISLPEGLQKKFESECDLIDLIGLTWYSGSSGVTPFAIGVQLGSIDESQEVDIDDINLLFSNPDLKDEYQKAKYKSIDIINEYIDCEGSTPTLDEVKKIIESCDPRKLIIWSTS